jgi:hypothetical protein
MVILTRKSFSLRGLAEDKSFAPVTHEFTQRLYLSWMMMIMLYSAELDLSTRGTEQWIPKVFIDPGGRHSLASVCSSSTADTYYIHGKWRKPRMLSRLKGLTLSSVAWNRQQINEGIITPHQEYNISFSLCP